MGEKTIDIEDLKELTKIALTSLLKMQNSQNNAIKKLMAQCSELQKIQLDMAQQDLTQTKLTEMTNKRINDLIKWLKIYCIPADDYNAGKAIEILEKI